MNELIYPKERTLGAITLVLGIVVWIALIVGTFGVALVFLAFGFIAYLFAQSALIASIRGNGVALTKTQFPDLYDQFVTCCDRLTIETRPSCYVVNSNGVLNAFATRFLGHQYVVLNSDVVDAMNKHAEGVRFYIGHELGHIRRKHLTGHFFRWPILWLPLLGAAYSRAKESTCDRHGLACCNSADGAAKALAALSAGPTRWESLDTASYLRQANEEPGFWMSFHELIAGYPWLTKRFARVIDKNIELPKRNPFAYILALLSPYAGRLGSGFGLLIAVYIIGVLAAIALPAYQDYTIRTKLQLVVLESKVARDSLSNYYESSHKIPDSLSTAGVSDTLSDGSTLILDPKNMLLTVKTAKGELIFVPRANSDGHVTWTCTNGEGLKPTQIPTSCRNK